MKKLFSSNDQEQNEGLILKNTLMGIWIGVVVTVITTVLFWLLLEIIFNLVNRNYEGAFVDIFSLQFPVGFYSIIWILFGAIIGGIMALIFKRFPTK